MPEPWINRSLKVARDLFQPVDKLTDGKRKTDIGKNSDGTPPGSAE
jgi:hypothetical protein